MTLLFIIDVSQLLRGSSLISKLHMGINCYPDVVPISHSSLCRQTEFVVTADFFSLNRWDPNASLRPSGPCLFMVDVSRACFGRSPAAAHCSSPGRAQLPSGSNSSDSRSPRESAVCCWWWRAKRSLLLILSVDSDVWLLRYNLMICSKMKLLPILWLTQYLSVGSVPAEIIGDQLLCEP